jgi:hypothetical protein
VLPGELSNRLKKMLAKLEDPAFVRPANALQAKLLAAQRKTLTGISEILAEMPGKSATLNQRLAWQAAQAKKLDALLAESGLFDAFDEFVKQQEELFRIGDKLLKIGDNAFTRVPSGYGKFLQEQTANNFAFLGQEASKKLQSTLLDMSIIGASQKDALTEFKGLVTGEYSWGSKKGLYEWHAATYVNTANQTTFQKYLNSQADGAEYFAYIGPTDDRTREFCLRHVGRVYHKNDIAKMNNGTQGDVMMTRGGWNCRHQWVPVNKEVADAINENPNVAKSAASGEAVQAKLPTTTIPEPSTIKTTSNLAQIEKDIKAAKMKLQVAQKELDEIQQGTSEFLSKKRFEAMRRRNLADLEVKRLQAQKKLMQSGRQPSTFSSRKKWADSLSSREESALIDWTNDEEMCSIMRQLNRGDDLEIVKRSIKKTMPPDMGLAYFQKQLDALNNAADWAPIYRGNVYRGLRSLSDADFERLLHSRGSTIQFDALSSASKELEIAQGFAEGGDLRAIFKMRATDVADISIMGVEGESEVLIRKGARFAVERITEQKGHNVRTLLIEMSQL